MNFTRKASLGRRVAVVLAVGALLLGGCDQQRATGSPDPGRQGRPAVSDSAASDTATSDTAASDAAGSDAAGSDAAGSDAAGSDVNGLLDEVDKQLNADDQPVEDQD
jgi:hypothetical protein